VVEVDGQPHLTPAGQQKDDARDKSMHAQGVEVLRFGGFQVENEIEQVLNAIDEALLRRCPKPKPK
jgi:very-short-patch-repair endonuclease